MRLIGVLVLVAGCHRGPDPRTAVELEQEAERKRSDALQARAMQNVQENTRPVPSGAERDMLSGVTPYGLEQGKAGYQEGTASELEGTAKKIRQNAELMCTRVAPSTRTSCPVGGKVGRIEKVELGVRLYPAKPPEAESLRDRVNCAIAQAKVDRPQEADACPLLVEGVETRVVDTPQGAYLEIVAPDEVRAAEVRRRAQGLLSR